MAILNDLLTGLTSLFSHQAGTPVLFSSGTFWLWFILFIAIYTFVHKQKTLMMLYVATFSLFFFYQSNGLVFFLLPITAILDFNFARLIHASSNPRARKCYLACSILLSIGILTYFKYTNFFIDTWNRLFAGNFRLCDLFLPVGISFYTFQSISYVVDVYKKKIMPTHSLLQYVFYISFFPLILAGPIMRADKFFPQITDKKVVKKEMIYGGLWLVIVGLIKKAVLADYLAQYNNWVFNDPLHYSGFEGLMAVVGYSAQIYCDFSGYSDMSIGIASIMGFDLGKNFNLPYQSTNLSEFWRRWHISLSTWMRDYIYIPLGGNRKGEFRTYINNLATMLVAGLWHGASWMFVIWGGLHGLGLALQKLNKPWLNRLPDNVATRFFSWLLTFSFVTFLWIFFRSSTMEGCINLIVHIGNDFDLAYLIPFFHARSTWCIFLILIFVLHAFPPRLHDGAKMLFIKTPWPVQLLIFALAVQLVVQFQTGNVQPFIYFQF